MYLRNLAVTALVGLTISAVPAVAETTTEDSFGFNNKSEANSVINEYKALRVQCTLSRGDERKSCFNALNKQNDLYASAKKYLAQSQSDGSSVHYVTFAE